MSEYRYQIIQKKGIPYLSVQIGNEKANIPIADIELSIEAHNRKRDILVDSEFFDHLLACMANQKYMPVTNLSPREQEDQRVIDKAYHKARELQKEKSR